MKSNYRYVAVSSTRVVSPSFISVCRLAIESLRICVHVCFLIEALNLGLGVSAAEQKRSLQVSMQFRDGATDLYAMVAQDPDDNLSTVKLAYTSVLSKEKNDTLTMWAVPFDQIWGTTLSQEKLTIFGTFPLPTETHSFIKFRSLLGVDVVHFSDEIKPVLSDNLVLVNQIDVFDRGVQSLLNGFDDVLRTLRDQFSVVFLQMDYRFHISQCLAERLIYDNSGHRNSGYRAILFDAIDISMLKTPPTNNGVLRVFRESGVWDVEKSVDRWDFSEASLRLKELRDRYPSVDFSLQETYFTNGLNNRTAPTRNFNTQHYPDMWCKIWRYELDQVLRSSPSGVLAIASGPGNAMRLRDNVQTSWLPPVQGLIGTDGAESPHVESHCEGLFQSFGTSFSYDPVQVSVYAEFLVKLPEKIDRIYSQYVSDIKDRGSRISSKRIEGLGAISNAPFETQMDVVYHYLKHNKRYGLEPLMSKDDVGSFIEKAFTWDVSPFIGQRTFLRFEYALRKNMGFNDFEVAGVLYSANSVLAKELPFVRFVVEPRFESGMALETYIYVANLPQSGQLYRAYFGKPLTESLADLFFRQNERNILKYMYPFMGEGFRIPQVASREFWLATQASRIDELSVYEVSPSMFFRLPKDSPNINRTALDEWRVCAKAALTGARNRVESTVTRIKSEATLYGRFSGFLGYFLGENKEL